MPDQTTERSWTAGQPGPVLLILDGRNSTADVEVTADPTVEHAHVVITGPESALADADATDTGSTLTVRIPPGPSIAAVHQSRGRTFIAGDSYGDMVISDGGVFVGGVSVGGSIVVGDGSLHIGARARLRVTARVPAGSTLRASGQSGDIRTAGQLAGAHIQTVAGDIDLDAVTSPDVRTVTGDIEVRQHSGDGRLVSVSGDITVHAVTHGRLTASTTSGDIRVDGERVDLDAHTVSGRVRSR